MLSRSVLLLPLISLGILNAGSPAPIRFRNVASPAGVDFVLENSATLEKQVIETMVGGVAVFDYDGDGLPDIFFTNGASLPGLEKNAPKYYNRLFRNLGGMKFKDVTAEAGLAGEGYCHGAAAADFDNDGHVDLFVAGVRSNHLYRNLGDGKFEDVTQKAGIRGGAWAITGGWFDYDNDGRLDLFVANYLKWSPENPPYCGDPEKKIRAYCHPRFYEGLTSVLYHNRGDGTFEDVSVSSGIAAHTGKAMSVSFADYDGDGLTDIFVTNDKRPNFLFHNLGNGKFEEVALEMGVALPENGHEVSGMGSDFRDFDNDGLPDIVFAALAGETFPIFRNLKGTGFSGASFRSGLAALSVARSGWSPALVDLNNDGWKDLFVSGGHVNDTVEVFEATKYKLPNSVFASAGDGTFQDVSAAAGPDFQAPRAHRGAAFADFNGDGKIDGVVTAIGEPAELWENMSPGDISWLTVQLQGVKSNRDGIGAKIRIGTQSNHMTSSVGYCSSSLSGVHFGLGSTKSVPRIEILWPSGIRQVLTDVAPNQVLHVREPEK
ncbi:MAG: CRTAC1 family protein [Bryobacteraceae bacterium]